VSAVMRSLLFLSAALAVVVAASPTRSSAADSVPSSWSLAVAGICDHALLFEGEHRIGTRQGALDVARDIRASTARRIKRIKALRVVSRQRRLSNRWLILEGRLADAFATNYLRIYDAIDAAKTRSQRSRLPRILERLLHAPDRLRAVAAVLEQRLLIPDCTGGGTPASAPPSAAANQ
jgi:hypothetical protein